MTRADFFRTLADTGFAPPESAVAEFARATGTEVPLTADARAEAAALIRPEVEAFAAVFWTLPPNERRHRWADLADRCRDGPANVFLGDLAKGTAVEIVEQVDGTAAELADTIRSHFVLRRGDRAARREAWLAGRGTECDWRRALKILKDRDPDTVALDPAFARAITAGNRGLAPLTRDQERAMTRRGRPAVSEPEPRQEYKPKGEGGGPGCGTYIAGVLVVKMIVLGIASLSSKSSTPSYTPSFTPPGGQAPSFTFPQSIWTKAQIDQFEKFDRQRANEPLGYPRWVQLGRPQAGAIFKPDDIVQYREFEAGNLLKEPAGYRTWVTGGRPKAAAVAPKAGAP